jgi:hypothetical protein
MHEEAQRLIREGVDVEELRRKAESTEHLARSQPDT